MEYYSTTTIKGGKVSWVTDLILKEKLKTKPNQQKIRRLQIFLDKISD